jgi:hypothetical protein
MYTKPALERFGTLRELTLLGIGSSGDGISLGFVTVTVNVLS